ncbi:primosomal protein N' [Alteromonas aestuariivivens]|uniref:Replication restart protein PriA n=1 Tax=Alteromonas aestuariivivens TaxID=1938339 RepID=A0A3D8M3R5_9ALTE|nr:primosomal protein N' [Alteromonas aestuariivivens]RDV24230.1 primosomal protein N' [Alteromonas aestuariivivens]
MVLTDVAVPVPLRQSFTYRAPIKLQPGVRVLVPFGNRRLVGIVVGEASAVQASGKLKDIAEILDEHPVLNGTLLRLGLWLSQYYHHPVGEVLHTMLPVKLRQGVPCEPEPETCYRLNCELAEQRTALKRAHRQLACLEHLRDGAQNAVQLKASFSPAVINALLEKQLIVAFDKAVEPQDWQQNLNPNGQPVPDSEQALAITAINQSANRFAPFLLEGVTGSGKTEVYLQAIEPVLKSGKQVLILVPEIGLTPQTVNRFRNRFGIEVGVLHSQLSDSARLRVWQQAKDGELGIIIGTRSAIFTPLCRPGMLIVDEEHDESFKQQDGLRYHARDLAVRRAQAENLPLVLGSATPSLESLNNALTKRYGHLQLTRRAGGAQTTRQHILDIRDQPINYGLAEGMLTVMRQHLEQGNQVLVFVNRRGYAPALLCHHCGDTVTCQRCERPFTVHRAHQRLHCHHCGAVKPVPRQCGHCHSNELVTAGVGTEQLEQGLSRLFPNAPQVRIDSDSVRGKDKLDGILEAINQQKFQLLIGTQILSKGHHFPHVTLVVVVDCDGALFSADFRAAEKLAQLVTQLAGRAGRASKPGEMWLQTHNPQHPLLQDLVNNGYAHFARHGLLERQCSGLPPFQSQVAFRAEAIQAEQAYDFLCQVRSLTDGEAEVQRLGPMPSLLEKRQGRFRFILILQSGQRGPLHRLLHRCLPAVTALPLAARVRWSVDVDPTDFS